MRREEKTAVARLSAREILAAWVCCGLIGLGGLLLDTHQHGRAGTQTVYTGIQLPGAGRLEPSDRSIADEFADAGDLPSENSVDTALVSRAANAPVEVRQCWLRSVVHHLL